MTELSSRAPSVSILVPTYNSERWILEALESAVAQSYEDTEIIVSDNASTDATVELVHSLKDERLRVHIRDDNIGLVGNHNALIRLARGSYLKFLHADDILLPQCVAAMVETAEEDPDIGLVFAAREVFSDDPDDAAWVAEFGNAHEHFAHLDRVNDGRPLALELLASGFVNWFGEPSAVLLSRKAIERVGMFNPRLRQIVDLDLWLRVALFFKVGFLDDHLVRYRHHGLSLSASNRSTGADWLDPLWLAESLVVASSGSEPALVALRRRRLLQAVKNQGLMLRARHVDAALLRYVAYRASARAGRGADIHPPLHDPEEAAR
jgi:glycosyltransferase involved in cell wall biosynthesis